MQISWDIILLSLVVLIYLYSAAHVVCAAYFRHKLSYHRKVLGEINSKIARQQRKEGQV